MKDLEKTKTQANLLAAFAAECMASVKYDFYAEKAKKEGFEQVYRTFMTISGNERAHAYVWYKLLKGTLKNTQGNLTDAADGEYAEWSEMYKGFSKDAKEEGFEEIAAKFEKTADVEQEHEQIYRTAAENIQNGKVFKQAESVAWVCLNCGHVHIGPSAPAVCPLCSHPQAYFTVKQQGG